MAHFSSGEVAQVLPVVDCSAVSTKTNTHSRNPVASIHVQPSEYMALNRSERILDPHVLLNHDNSS